MRKEENISQYCGWKRVGGGEKMRKEENISQYCGWKRVGGGEKVRKEENISQYHGGGSQRWRYQKVWKSKSKKAKNLHVIEFKTDL